MNENYYQITIPVSDGQEREILVAQLAELGFEGFEDREDALVAFVPEDLWNEKVVTELLTERGHGYTSTIVAQQNWNAQWESSFEPVVVGTFCAIRAHFHEPVAGVKHDIVITPKMSFGTGHHATTAMMVEHIGKLPMIGKSVVDYGTGTGILAILAEKEGADSVLAIDNDPWSIDNAAENIARNSCTNITLVEGETIPPGRTFDVVLANITKHILLGQKEAIIGAAKPGGTIVLSGLLNEDLDDITEAFTTERSRLVAHTSQAQWISVLFSVE